MKVVMLVTNARPTTQLPTKLVTILLLSKKLFISMQQCFVPLAGVEVWQSSVSDSSASGWEALQSTACTHTKTGDDYPFIVINFGTDLTVSNIAVSPPLSPTGKLLNLGTSEGQCGLP